MYIYMKMFLYTNTFIPVYMHMYKYMYNVHIHVIMKLTINVSFWCLKVDIDAVPPEVATPISWSRWKCECERVMVWVE